MNFDTKEYLQEYYRDIDSENEFLLNFYNKVYHLGLAKGGSLLEVGGGPTIYQLISASGSVGSITFTEYEQSNRDEIKMWKRGNHDSAFDWSHYFKYVSEIELGDGNQWKLLQDRLRNKIISVEPVDLLKSNPFPASTDKNFDIVSSAFCIEGIVSDKPYLEIFLGKLLNKLKVDGYLVTTTILECEKYKLGNNYFPSIYIKEHELTNLLSKRFNMEILLKTSTQASIDRGYKEILAICAKKVKPN